MVDNSSENCLKIANVSRDFHLEASRFSHCREAAILVASNGLIDLDNVTINSGSIGVKVDAVQGHLSLRDSRIFAMTSSAMDVNYMDNTNEGNLTVENSAIYNCSSGIQYLSNNYHSNTRVRIYNNSLTSIESNALMITLTLRHRYYNNSDLNERKVDVVLNTFDGVCDILLRTRNNVNLTCYGNTVRNCDCRDSTECLFAVKSISHALIANRAYDVSANIFRNNTGQCLIRMTSLRIDSLFYGTFFYNQLLENDVIDGVGISVVAFPSNQIVITRIAGVGDAVAIDIGPIVAAGAAVGVVANAADGIVRAGALSVTDILGALVSVVAAGDACRDVAAVGGF